MNKPKSFLITITIFLCLLMDSICYANIHAIDFSKVGYPTSLQSSIDYLKKNEGLYNHWSPQWKYDIKKESVINELASLYAKIDQLSSKNLETFLLLGDIAHFIYNLDQEPYYQKALDNYKLAVQLAPDDYRVYWFLANHYALSNQPILAIETYQKALEYPACKSIGYFWFDYSQACIPAGMTSTGIYAAEQANKLQPSEFLANEIRQIKKSIVQPKTDTTIQAKNMWSFAGKIDGKIVLANRVLGIRLAIDSNWHLQPSDFSNGTAAVPLEPETIISKKNNQPIGYSILILAKVPQHGQTLKSFLMMFSKKYDSLKPVQLTDKYPGIIGYEVLDKSIYQNIGGGHMYMLAFERDEPDYPGIVLETANSQLAKGAKGLSYYRLDGQFTRLKSKIYYLVMLDTCGDIHDESLIIFKNFLENGLVVE